MFIVSNSELSFYNLIVQNPDAHKSPRHSKCKRINQLYSELLKSVINTRRLTPNVTCESRNLETFDKHKMKIDTTNLRVNFAI